VATDKLCHVEVGFYPAILKPILDAVEVMEGRPALLRDLPSLLPLLNGFFNYFSLAASFVVASLFSM
jgi:hypothetical protein